MRGAKASIKRQRSCAACAASKRTCDHSTPCGRCIKLGLECFVLADRRRADAPPRLAGKSTAQFALAALQGLVTAGVEAPDDVERMGNEDPDGLIAQATYIPPRPRRSSTAAAIAHGDSGVDGLDEEDDDEDYSEGDDGEAPKRRRTLGVASSGGSGGGGKGMRRSVQIARDAARLSRFVAAAAGTGAGDPLQDGGHPDTSDDEDGHHSGDSGRGDDWDYGHGAGVGAVARNAGGAVSAARGARGGGHSRRGGGAAPHIRHHDYGVEPASVAGSGGPGPFVDSEADFNTFIGTVPGVFSSFNAGAAAGGSYGGGGPMPAPVAHGGTFPPYTQHPPALGQTAAMIRSQGFVPPGLELLRATSLAAASNSGAGGLDAGTANGRRSSPSAYAAGAAGTIGGGAVALGGQTQQRPIINPQFGSGAWPSAMPPASTTGPLSPVHGGGAPWSIPSHLQQQQQQLQHQQQLQQQRPTVASSPPAASAAVASSDAGGAAGRGTDVLGDCLATLATAAAVAAQVQADRSTRGVAGAANTSQLRINSSPTSMAAAAMRQQQQQRGATGMGSPQTGGPYSVSSLIAAGSGVGLHVPSSTKPLLTLPPTLVVGLTGYGATGPGPLTNGISPLEVNGRGRGGGGGTPSLLNTSVLDDGHFSPNWRSPSVYAAPPAAAPKASDAASTSGGAPSGQASSGGGGAGGLGALQQRAYSVAMPGMPSTAGGGGADVAPPWDEGSPLALGGVPAGFGINMDDARPIPQSGTASAVTSPLSSFTTPHAASTIAAATASGSTAVGRPAVAPALRPVVATVPMPVGAAADVASGALAVGDLAPPSSLADEGSAGGAFHADRAVSTGTEAAPLRSRSDGASQPGAADDASDRAYGLLMMPPAPSAGALARNLSTGSDVMTMQV